MPPHLHISIETLDSVYMTTSMFYEIPLISDKKFAMTNKVVNKNFRKLIEQYDQKGIQFVPTTSRDFIVFASRNLHQSKWVEAVNNLQQIKVFQKMPEFQLNLKEALATKCKEVALRIFYAQNQ